MPLIKSASKQARNANIKTEIAAGRPPKQAEAIGYSVQRKAAGKKAPPKARSKATARGKTAAKGKVAVSQPSELQRLQQAAQIIRNISKGKLGY